MTCPRCHSEFEAESPVCPECGVRLLRNISGVMKTSGVLIEAGGERGFYRSVQDVPEPLRTQLLETTTSPNSGIIVIADRAGKEQLTQVLARREASRKTAEEIPAGQIPIEPARSAIPDAPPAPLTARLPWLAWAGFVLVLVLAGIFLAIFQMHW